MADEQRSGRCSCPVNGEKITAVSQSACVLIVTLVDTSSPLLVVEHRSHPTAVTARWLRCGSGCSIAARKTD